MSRLEVRFEVCLHPDTEDAEEARQEALDLIQSIKESWYSVCHFQDEAKIQVVEVDDDDE